MGAGIASVTFLQQVVSGKFDLSGLHLLAQADSKPNWLFGQASENATICRFSGCRKQLAPCGSEAFLFFAAPLLQLQPVAVGSGFWRRIVQSVSGSALGAPSTRPSLLGALFSDTVTRGG